MSESRVDFRIKKLDEIRGGLIMEIRPGGKATGPRRADSVFIDEDAFGCIEHIIKGRCPEYSHWGHSGMTEIPKTIWVEIVSDLVALQKVLASAQSIDDVPLGPLFVWVNKAFRTRFDENRVALSRLISELCEWILREIQSKAILTICGI
jgi:hypothetical protein